MPELSHDQLKVLISEGKLFAISVDTAVFDAKQKNFRGPVLRRLDQFHQRGIRVVIVDVIADEMKAHLRDDAAEKQSKLRKALSDHNRRWRRVAKNGEETALLINADATSFAQAEFDEFLRNVQGEEIFANDTPDAVKRVFEDYFAMKPPFGNSEKRKNEFPDAFALTRLDSFAAEQGKILVCVSPDKGWIEYAAESENLVCMSRLEDVFRLIYAADEHHQYIADSIVERWRRYEDGQSMNELYKALENHLEDIDFDINADSGFYYEQEPLGAELQSTPPLIVDHPIVIAVDGKDVTFFIEVEAQVRFNASFDFFVYDSIDKEELSLGSEEFHAEKTLPFDLTVTASWSRDEGLIFHEIEVVKKNFRVDFGYVKPFHDEERIHE